MESKKFMYNPNAKGNVFRKSGRASISKGIHYANYDGKLEIINVERNSNLFVQKLTEKGMKFRKDTHYKYLITTNATSHTAFSTDKGYNEFLKNHKLKEDKKSMTENEYGKYFPLIGTEERVYMAGTYKQLDEFGEKKKLKPIAVLDNGDYTRGYVEDNKVYLLNPNYPRKILKYRWE